MSVGNENARQEAIEWLMRLREPGADDWEAFTLWLEADPAHAAAYDAVALADEGLERLAPPVPMPPVEWAPPRHRLVGRRALVGWGMAAAVAGIIGITVFPTAADESYAVETRPGEQRSIALAEGSRIDLNGASRVVLDRSRPRFARLEQGEALFTVVHDAGQPFEVEAGGEVLRDLGTVFNVIREGDAVEVAVAEGAVLFNPGREAVRLEPGMALRREGEQAPRVARREVDAITGWREGRLTYSGTSLSQVAADLTRNLGVQVRASNAVAGRSFTGVIFLEGDAVTVLRRAQGVIGVHARRTGEGWTLMAGEGGSP